jgi:nitrite reductase (NO-forming)
VKENIVNIFMDGDILPPLKGVGFTLTYINILSRKANTRARHIASGPRDAKRNLTKTMESIPKGICMGKSWFGRNVRWLKSAIRVVFGIVWLVDASFKFQPSFSQTFSTLLSGAAAGQPAWLAGWFYFWANITSTNPAFFAYLIAVLELALAISLILGFMRKVGYTGGFLLSLVIWSVPESFGGPYGPSATDIGTGIIYAIAFLMLMIINMQGGTSKYSLDRVIEKRVKWWRKLAEFG